MKTEIPTELKNFKSNVRRAILPTILVTAIFFMTLRFFGMENTMIGTSFSAVFRPGWSS
ncbi:MAG: hypothetical protein LUC41_07845 [Clostridiales bacterium]|nr:hypothetical protein [Clostridiales bacterium]